MPGYLARVKGENFKFEFDDDLQSLNFTRTVYVDAEDEAKAELSALDAVQQQLRSHALWNEQGEQRVTVDELELYSESSTLSVDQDFFWYFTDEGLLQGNG